MVLGKPTWLPDKGGGVRAYRFSDGQNVVQLQRIVMANGKEMLLYGRR